MSTEIGKIQHSGSRSVELSIVRYWGGEANGACLQLTAQAEDGSYGYVQLSASDIVALMPEFNALIRCELERKKKEAQEAIAENKDLEKTIVSDMREVADMGIKQCVFDASAWLFFRNKKIIAGQPE